MYNIGETLVYAGAGLCTLADIRSEKFDSEKKTYYILKPLNERGSTFYHPVDGDESKLRNVISAEAAAALLDCPPENTAEWIAYDAQRKEIFDSILKEGNPAEVLTVIIQINKHRQEMIEQGKKLRANDEKNLAKAIKNISEEFAFVLKMSEEEIAAKLKSM